MSAVKKSKRFIAAGSPVGGEPAFLVIGKIRRPHGVRGDVLMEVLSDFPERIQPGVTVYVGELAQPHQITGCRAHKDGLILHFAPYSTAEAVSALRNAYVFVRADDRPALGAGEFYHHQFLGLEVYTDQGEALGKIVEILETGANDVFCVQDVGEKKIYIPYVDDFVIDVDIKQGKITVHLIPGLI